MLQRMRRPNDTLKVFSVALLTLIELAVMLTIDSYEFHVWFIGVILYIIAYLFGEKWREQNSTQYNICLFLIIVLSVGTRLFMRVIADDTAIYNRVIVPYTQCSIGIAGFLILFHFAQNDSIAKVLETNKGILAKCDRYSFSVYIVHYMFITGVLSFQNITSVKCVNVAFAIAAIAAYSVLLNWITKVTNGQIRSKR